MQNKSAEQPRIPLDFHLSLIRSVLPAEKLPDLFQPLLIRRLHTGQLCLKNALLLPAIAVIGLKNFPDAVQFR